MAEIGKKYKLVKDLPTFRADDQFELRDDGCLYWVRGWRNPDEVEHWSKEVMAYHRKTLERFPNILKDWFEEIPEEHKRWRAEKSREYWYIDNLGLIYWSIEMRSAGDDFCYNTGNYFRTKEEAEKDREYQIALQTLKDDAKGFVPDYTESKINFSVYYDYSSSKLDIRVNAHSATIDILFSTYQSAVESIKLHEKEWKTVLGVEK